MNNLLQRIKQFVDYKELTVRAFEIKVGFSNGAFASQLKNNKTIGSDKLENILNDFPELSAEWLLRGEGEMIRDLNKAETTVPHLTDSEKLNQILERLETLEQRDASKPGEVRSA